MLAGKALLGFNQAFGLAGGYDHSVASENWSLPMQQIGRSKCSMKSSKGDSSVIPTSV